MNAYDQVLYPSYSHPQTHPSRIAPIAALLGMNPAPVTRCRVLEIGCGNGSNLVPMAWSLPESRFWGIDLAARPVAVGNEMIADLGLKNAWLKEADLLNLQPGWEEFDYILAHGVYSWVPGKVQDHLLALCRGCLAPDGVAFISYNAFPGCHLRNMTRDMMRFHVQGLETPQERIEQATALVRFLAEAQDTPDPYRIWMKVELEKILEYSPGHLYHDELAELNQPFYFTQFMSSAHRHQLQFLGEADFFEMSDHIFSPVVQQRLQDLAKNRILREQYLDFLKCRRFRQTLLCRQEATLASSPSESAVTRFVVASAVDCGDTPVDLRPGIPVRFEVPKGAKAETDFPLGKAALKVLSEQGLAGLAFDALELEARKRLAQAAIPTEESSAMRSALAGFLLRLYTVGVVEFRSHAANYLEVIGERPAASALARWQIRHGNFVTSLAHIAVQVQDEIGQQLLRWLDGTLSRAQLTEKVWDFVQSRRPSTGGSTPVTVTRQQLEEELATNLNKLARLGLLVA